MTTKINISNTSIENLCDIFLTNNNFEYIKLNYKQKEYNNNISNHEIIMKNVYSYDTKDTDKNHIFFILRSDDILIDNIKIKDKIIELKFYIYKYEYKYEDNKKNYAFLKNFTRDKDSIYIKSNYVIELDEFMYKISKDISYIPYYYLNDKSEILDNESIASIRKELENLILYNQNLCEHKGDKYESYHIHGPSMMHCSNCFKEICGAYEYKQAHCDHTEIENKIARDENNPRQKIEIVQCKNCGKKMGNALEYYLEKYNVKDKYDKDTKKLE